MVTDVQCCIELPVMLNVDITYATLRPVRVCMRLTPEASALRMECTVHLHMGRTICGYLCLM